MKGQPQVIELPNDVLADALVAIHGYFMHAKMCASCGHRKLAAAAN